MASTFSFDTSKFKSPKEMERKLQRAIYGVCKFWDGRVEAYAKQNAPWTDRTSNARNGLFARAYKLGKTTFGIILAHSVDYGIWLEVRNRPRGRAARPIIMKTVNLYAPKVTKTLTKILDRL